MKIHHAVIMAAGRGMRMMPLTENMPKAMAPFAGTTLIANGIDKILKHLDTVHITVGYKGSMLAKHVIEHNVSSVINTEGKDNAWWIYNTLLAKIDEPVFVLTCDNVIELNFSKIEEDYFRLGEPACMVVPVKPIQGLEGDYIFHEKQLVRKLSRTEASDSYCSGIQVLNPVKINRLTKRSDNFYQVWEQLIKQEQLYSSRIYPDQWYAVDTMDQLNTLNR